MWTTANEIDRMFGAMDLLRSRMNRIFTDFGRRHDDDYGWPVINQTPRTNLYDSGGQMKLIAEVPGISKEELSIRIQGNYLELSGTRKADAPKGFKAHRVERGTSSFTRSFTLPAEVDAERVEAVLKEGILTLVLPKSEAARPRQISIK